MYLFTNGLFTRQILDVIRGAKKASCWRPSLSVGDISMLLFRMMKVAVRGRCSGGILALTFNLVKWFVRFFFSYHNFNRIEGHVWLLISWEEGKIKEKQRVKRTYFTGGPVVKASPPSAGHAVQSLVRQLRSHMPLGQKPKQKIEMIL